MKKYILVIVCWVFSVFVSKAQVSEQEADLIRSILKSEVKVFFAQNIKLKTAEANLFWEIYDSYEDELLPVGNRRIAILKQLIEGQGKMSEEEVDALIKESVKMESKRRQMRWKYYKIYKKKLNVTVAAQFYQLDIYINTHVAAAILEGSPMVIPAKN